VRVIRLSHDDKILMVACLELGKTRIEAPFLPTRRPPPSNIIIDSETGILYRERKGTEGFRRRSDREVAEMFERMFRSAGIRFTVR